MPAKPVDMKLTKTDLKERGDVAMPVAGKESGPKYPWGLTLRLDKITLEKLGLKDDLPDVGVLAQIMGVGRVVSVNERETQGGKECDVEIQIEKLNLAVEDEDAAFEKGARKGKTSARY